MFPQKLIVPSAKLPKKDIRRKVQNRGPLIVTVFEENVFYARKNVDYGKTRLTSSISRLSSWPCLQSMIIKRTNISPHLGLSLSLSPPPAAAACNLNFIYDI